MAELVRRQYLVTEDNVAKLESISKTEGISATEVVRRAIEAYQPGDDDTALEQWVDMMTDNVREAIKEVRHARKVVRRANKDFFEKKAN